MQIEKKHLRIPFSAVLAVTILLTACRAPSPTEAQSPTQDINALYTQVAGTLIAEGQQAAAPTDTPLVVTATSSPTPEGPTATPSNTPVNSNQHSKRGVQPGRLHKRCYRSR